MKTIIRFLSPQELKHSRAFFELSIPRFFPWFLYGVLILLLFASLWIWLGNVEVVVRATGVLRPTENISEVMTTRNSAP